MKLFIPRLGSRLILAKNWTFKLYDERRNEKFWLALHGKPEKEEFYYGYPTGGYTTSPVKTKDCPSLGHKPAKPAKTTLPKGTVLTIERIYIRRGAGEFDSISFRIAQDKTLGVPSGRFWVKLEDINNLLDATVEIVNKYPQGKFYLNVIEGKTYQCKLCGKTEPWQQVRGNPSYCCCTTPSHPHYRTNVLGWMSNPDGSHWQHGRLATVVHTVDDDGLDDLVVEPRRSYNSSDGYSKSFNNLDEMLTWAVKKNFTKAHIDVFMARYEEKKAQAEKDNTEEDEA